MRRERERARGLLISASIKGIQFIYRSTPPRLLNFHMLLNLVNIAPVGIENMKMFN